MLGTEIGSSAKEQVSLTAELFLLSLYNVFFKATKDMKRQEKVYVKSRMVAPSLRMENGKPGKGSEIPGMSV